MRFHGILAAPFLLVSFLQVPIDAFASTIHVRQDGSGDYLTITAAVAAASAGDSIAVGPGTYAEGATVDVSVPLIIFSTHGALATVVDGAGLHRLLDAHAPSITITGLSLRNGFGAGICANACGGAAIIWQGAQVQLVDCHFEDNTAFSGGALYVTQGSLLDVSRCLFRNNSTAGAGGATMVVGAATASFEECTFVDNGTGLKGGAVYSLQSTANFERCLFRGNRSGDVAGAMFIESSNSVIRNNTFFDHTSPGLISGTITIQLGSTMVTGNIIAGETSGYGIRYYQGGGPHSCNVFWGTADGPIGEGVLDGTEIEENPNFCDAANGDFTLSDNSPAAPDRSACGVLIGAFPVRCSLPAPGAPRITSIVDVPNDNGRQVRIKWERSSYDAAGQSFRIVSYGIYRQEGTQKSRPLALPGAGSARRQGLAVDGWDFVAVVPARGDDAYQCVAPTLCDRPLLGGNPNEPECTSVFFVSAMTPDPLHYFDSAPDSGYSTDDTPPFAPQALHLVQRPEGVELNWQAPDGGDVVEFHVYRGLDPEFELSLNSLVQVLQGTLWLDRQGLSGRACYKVTAVDDAGNESDAAFAALRRPEVPHEFALYQNHPNPFNPTTRIYFDVPEAGGPVRLTIFDIAGRRVRRLLDGFETAGREKYIEWNGRGDGGEKLASGIYVYRLEAPGYHKTRRMTLLD